MPLRNVIRLSTVVLLLGNTVYVCIKKFNRANLLTIKTPDPVYYCNFCTYDILILQTFMETEDPYRNLPYIFLSKQNVSTDECSEEGQFSHCDMLLWDAKKQLNVLIYYHCIYDVVHQLFLTRSLDDINIRATDLRKKIMVNMDS